MKFKVLLSAFAFIFAITLSSFTVNEEVIQQGWFFNQITQQNDSVDTTCTSLIETYNCVVKVGGIDYQLYDLEANIDVPSKKLKRNTQSE